MFLNSRLVIKCYENYGTDERYNKITNLGISRSMKNLSSEVDVNQNYHLWLKLKLVSVCSENEAFVYANKWERLHRQNHIKTTSEMIFSFQKLNSTSMFECHFVNHFIVKMKMNTILLFFSLCSSKLISSAHVAPQIRTEYGPVQGSVSQYRGIHVLEYKGIPYAKAPIGKNRFLPPSKPDPWITPIDASEYGPACIQQGKFR